MINQRAEYYFKLPQAWQLDSASDYEDVKVLHLDSGASFTVHYAHNPGGTPTMYFMSLTASIQSPDYKWLSMGKGFVKLGGREAIGVRGTRLKNDKKVKEFIWIALVGEYVYMLSATVDLEKYDARAAEIDQIFSSFSWGKPATSP